jgi:aminomethyltransferase
MATRNDAGLFDVSHMGRFRIRGAHATTFLSRALTCDVAALTAGKAAYAFIATPSGGAVDDAYLYMLDEDDFLLVVNASNRAKDRAWLDELMIDGVSLEDESDALAMIALQGPQSQHILQSLVSNDVELPGKRNLLAFCTIDGHSLMISRTGYTGESVCFELFPDTDYAPTLWQRLIDCGATAVGLGARDSLRLEAGLPLYGHELGVDHDGHEIPVFANDLARFAVRGDEHKDYIGADAMTRQRDEYQRIKQGDFEADWRPKVLTHMIRPIAVFNGRRPIRADYTVLHQGAAVGRVTSGAVVPVSQPDTQSAKATATRERVLRPIGLALIDSKIRFCKTETVTFELVDDRGKSFPAELVGRHLQPRVTPGRTK